MEDLGKLIVAKGFKKLAKVQNIAQSGHTVQVSVFTENFTTLLIEAIPPIFRSRVAVNFCTLAFIILGRTINSTLRPDLAIFCTLGDFLKPLATIILLKSPTVLGTL